MKKDSVKYKISPKGKRHLDFPHKSKSSVKLPLIGKTIYLDVKETKHLKRLQYDLKKLGATLEEFVSRDINYLITTQDRPNKKPGDHGDISPAPSPFNCDPSPSPSNPEEKRVPTVTRGKALAEKARFYSRETATLLDNAEKWGVKIIHLKAAFKWIDKELKKLPKGTSAKKSERTKCIAKYQTFKAPFLKFETSKHHYRPLTQQLDVWPRLNVDTPRGSCPFNGTTIARGDSSNEERGDMAAQVDITSAETPGEEQDCIESNTTPKHEAPPDVPKKKSEPDIFGRGCKVMTQGELKRRRDIERKQKRNRGYCECCRCQYEDLDKHIALDQHKLFVRNKANFRNLDDMILSAPDNVQFLQKYLVLAVKNTVQKRKTRQSECEDIDLIPITPAKVNNKLSPKPTRTSPRKSCNTTPVFNQQKTIQSPSKTIQSSQKTVPSPCKRTQSPHLKTIESPCKTAHDSPKKNISKPSPRKTLPQSPRRTLQPDLKDIKSSSQRSPRKSIVFGKSTVVTAKSPGKNKQKEETICQPELKNKPDIIRSSQRKLSRNLLNEDGNDEKVQQNNNKDNDETKICRPIQSPNKNKNLNKVVNKDCEEEGIAILQSESPRKKHLPSDMKSQPREGKDIHIDDIVCLSHRKHLKRKVAEKENSIDSVSIETTAYCESKNINTSQNKSRSPMTLANENSPLKLSKIANEKTNRRNISSCQNKNRSPIKTSNETSPIKLSRKASDKTYGRKSNSQESTEQVHINQQKENEIKQPPFKDSCNTNQTVQNISVLSPRKSNRKLLIEHYDEIMASRSRPAKQGHEETIKHDDLNKTADEAKTVDNDDVNPARMVIDSLIKLSQKKRTVSQGSSDNFEKCISGLIEAGDLPNVTKDAHMDSDSLEVTSEVQTSTLLTTDTTPNISDAKSKEPRNNDKRRSSPRKSLNFKTDKSENVNKTSQVKEHENNLAVNDASSEITSDEENNVNETDVCPKKDSKLNLRNPKVQYSADTSPVKKPGKRQQEVMKNLQKLKDAKIEHSDKPTTTTDCYSDIPSDFMCYDQDGQVLSFTKTLAERIKERNRRSVDTYDINTLSRGGSRSRSNSFSSVKSGQNHESGDPDKLVKNVVKNLVKKKVKSSSNLASNRVVTKYRNCRLATLQKESHMGGYHGDDESTKDISEKEVLKAKSIPLSVKRKVSKQKFWCYENVVESEKSGEEIDRNLPKELRLLKSPFSTIVDGPRRRNSTRYDKTNSQDDTSEVDSEAIHETNNVQPTNISEGKRRQKDTKPLRPRNKVVYKEVTEESNLESESEDSEINFKRRPSVQNHAKSDTDQSKNSVKELVESLNDEDDSNEENVNDIESRACTRRNNKNSSRSARQKQFVNYDENKSDLESDNNKNVRACTKRYLDAKNGRKSIRQKQLVNYEDNESMESSTTDIETTDLDTTDIDTTDIESGSEDTKMKSEKVNIRNIERNGDKNTLLDVSVETESNPDTDTDIKKIKSELKMKNNVEKSTSAKKEASSKNNRKRFWEYVAASPEKEISIDKTLPKELQYLHKDLNNFPVDSIMDSRLRHKTMPDQDIEENKLISKTKITEKENNFDTSDSEMSDIKIQKKTSGHIDQDSEVIAMGKKNRKRKNNRRQFWEYVAKSPEKEITIDPTLPQELRFLKQDLSNFPVDYTANPRSRRQTVSNKESEDNKLIAKIKITEKGNKFEASDSEISDIEKEKKTSKIVDSDAEVIKKGKNNRKRFWEYVVPSPEKQVTIDKTLPKELQLLQKDLSNFPVDSITESRSRRQTISDVDEKSQVISKVKTAKKENIIETSNSKVTKLKKGRTASEGVSSDTEVIEKVKRSRKKYWEYVPEPTIHPELKKQVVLPPEVQMLQASWNDLACESDNERSSRRKSHSSISIESKDKLEILTDEEVVKTKKLKNKWASSDLSNCNSPVNKPKINIKVCQNENRVFSKTEPMKESENSTLQDTVSKATVDSGIGVEDANFVEKEKVSGLAQTNKTTAKTKKQKFWEYIAVNSPEKEPVLEKSVPKELQILHDSWNNVLEESGRQHRRRNTLMISQNGSHTENDSLKSDQNESDSEKLSNRRLSMKEKFNNENHRKNKDKQVVISSPQKLDNDKTHGSKQKIANSHNQNHSDEKDETNIDKLAYNTKSKLDRIKRHDSVEAFMSDSEIVVKKSKKRPKFWEYVVESAPSEEVPVDSSLPKELQSLHSSWNSLASTWESDRSSRRSKGHRNSSVDRASSIDNGLMTNNNDTVKVKQNKGNEVHDLENLHTKDKINNSKQQKKVNKRVESESPTRKRKFVREEENDTDRSQSPKFNNTKLIKNSDSETTKDCRSSSPVFQRSPVAKKKKVSQNKVETCDQSKTINENDTNKNDTDANENIMKKDVKKKKIKISDEVRESVGKIQSENKSKNECEKDRSTYISNKELQKTIAQSPRKITTPIKTRAPLTPTSGYSNTPREHRRKQWKRKKEVELNSNVNNEQEKKRRKLDKLKYNDEEISSQSEQGSSPRKKPTRQKLEMSFEASDLGSESLTKPEINSATAEHNQSNTENVNCSLKWKPIRMNSVEEGNKVKLNTSWTLLSHKSVTKLLSSEGDRESFHGFTDEDLEKDNSLPSDLSYEELSEVDMGNNSDHEWVVENEKNKEDKSDEEVEIAPFLPNFSSPGKMSNSSWDDACDIYIDKSLKQGPDSSFKGPNSSMYYSFTSPWKSPRRKFAEQNAASQNQKTTPKKHLNFTPKRLSAGFVSPTTEMVDQEIEFNFNSPQKNRSDFSPLRVKNGKIFDRMEEKQAHLKTSTPAVDRKKLKKKKLVKQYDGLVFSCDDNYTTDSEIETPEVKEFKILKKVSNVKKSFTLGYEASPEKKTKKKKKFTTS